MNYSEKLEYDTVVETEMSDAEPLPSSKRPRK